MIPTPYAPLYLQTPPQLRHEDDVRGLELMLAQCASLSEFWESCSRVDWMLRALEQSARGGSLAEDVRPALRRFACWVAVEAGADPEDAALVYAGALADGRKRWRALRKERDAQQGWIAAVGSEAMPRCIPVAAAALAAWYAGDDDIFAGARWTAEFAIKATVFAEAEAWAPHWIDPDDDGDGWRLEWHTRAWLRAHPAKASRIRQATEEHFARGLRVVIRDPFQLQPQH